MIHLYCDGSFSNKKKKGGYAVVAFNGRSNKPLYIYKKEVPDPTSNVCELSGLIRALEICKMAKAKDFIIHCDSKYCVNAYNKWMDGWKSRGWKKSNKEKVKNLDLVKKLYNLRHQLTSELQKDVQVVWIRGHDGNTRNDIADREAKSVVYG